MTSQEQANIALGHHWLSRRCHPNDHARRRELFDRLMDEPYLYEQTLDEVAEAMNDAR